MDRTTHEFLDGDADAASLPPEARARARAARRTLDAAAAHLRAAPAPDLSARVMAALPTRAPRPSPARAAWAWLWRPRPLRLQFRPAFALAGAGLAAAAAVVVPQVAPDGRAPAAAAPPPAEAAAPVVYVQFRLETPEARQVALAGTFTGWQPTLALHESEPGVWTALVPLRPGVHDYVFVIDGEQWVPDPAAAQQVDDSFGGTNSRLSLPPLGGAA